MKKTVLVVLAVVYFGGTQCIPAQSGKPATLFTQQINQAEYQRLNFADSADYKDAVRGFIAAPESDIILNAKGEPATDLRQYDFIKGKAPATVNPALWRHAEINTIRGLFKVTDDVYQVRGLDLTNITFIKTQSGYLVIDPLTNPNATKAAFDLVKKHVGNYPIIAIISTHSHTDHFGGISGLAKHEDILSGKIKYIAPKGFYEEAVSENVFLGNAMGRRGIYQFALGTPANVTGRVDNGLGKFYLGAYDPAVLWRPNIIIDHTGQKLNIDGVELVFQYTPETEAPAEMMFFYPAKKIFFVAELGNRTLHNVLPPRGVKVRDARSWAAYLDETVTLFGNETEFVVPAHTWPFFGKERSLNFLEKQRDLYKYIHDQTIHLANLGLNQEEIAATIRLPESLDKEWFNQDFYGTVRHNVKAVYQYYIGWFDGHPANYDRLTPKEEAVRYVEWFGGEKAALEKAAASYEKGDYRWVIQALKWVVFANGENKEARNLQADAFEQLGYQSRSSIWRNMYLTAAKELREGNVTKNLPRQNKSYIKDLTIDDLFTFLSISIDGTKAAGKEFQIRFDISDEKQSFYVFLKNGVLHHKPSSGKERVQFALTLPKSKLLEFISTPENVDTVVNSQSVKTTGDISKLKLLASLITVFDINWNIITD
ncbi:MAG: MBL fold metallo-hydrolase [Flavobacteriaceae bacterium]|jgi:alkyl sulfatase BDS1-like metallo-beta-lactamase superfamily hydrolase|nr:MBL fold metallo-hydrolase [Flavobacteriaceae bacterium]